MCVSSNCSCAHRFNIRLFSWLVHVMIQVRYGGNKAPLEQLNCCLSLSFCLRRRYGASLSIAANRRTSILSSFTHPPSLLSQHRIFSDNGQTHLSCFIHQIVKKVDISLFVYAAACRRLLLHLYPGSLLIYYIHEPAVPLLSTR